MKRSRILTVIIPLLLLASAGGFFVGTRVLGISIGLPFLASGSPSNAPVAEASGHVDGTRAAPGITYQMPGRVVNLADAAVFRYLKIGLVLEFETAEANRLDAASYKKRQEELKGELSSRTPMMEDTIIAVLTRKTSDEISTTAGKEQLKEELKEKLNQVLGPHRVTNIYFTEFIIQ